MDLTRDYQIKCIKSYLERQVGFSHLQILGFVCNIYVYIYTYMPTHTYTHTRMYTQTHICYMKVEAKVSRGRKRTMGGGKAEREAGNEVLGMNVV